MTAIAPATRPERSANAGSTEAFAAVTTLPSASKRSVDAAPVYFEPKTTSISGSANAAARTAKGSVSTTARRAR